MLGFVPLRGEPVGCPDEQLLPLDLERFGWFEPGFERLFRQFLSRSIEKARPGFLCSECHEVVPVWKTRGAAKLCAYFSNRNDTVFT